MAMTLQRADHGKVMRVLVAGWANLAPVGSNPRGQVMKGFHSAAGLVTLAAALWLCAARAAQSQVASAGDRAYAARKRAESLKGQGKYKEATQEGERAFRL